MAKQIFEIKAYEYDTEESMQRDITALKNSSWKVINTYKQDEKWIAEYKKSE